VLEFAALLVVEFGGAGVRVDDGRTTDSENAVQTAGALAAEATAESHESFGIMAAASLERVRRLVLKHGDSFGVFDNYGDAVSGPGSAEGLYHRDMRDLSNFAVTIEGARPMLLSSTLRDDNATLTCAPTKS
jgi:N-terminal domain of (some) glycogen debranching enzymes